MFGESVSVMEGDSVTYTGVNEVREGDTYCGNMEIKIIK